MGWDINKRFNLLNTMPIHLCNSCKLDNNCDIQIRNPNIRERIACVNYQELKKCEICYEILTEENTQTSDNRKRCDNCYEEWGDNYPDRI